MKVSPRPCDHCGKVFKPKENKVRACCTDCGYIARSKRLEVEGLDALRGLANIRPSISLAQIATKKPKGNPPKHLVIPDVQVHAGTPMQHLSWVGNYIAEKRPDVIIQIGDFADMPSLSSYDKGKKVFEGRRYVSDIEAAIHAMELLTKPWKKIKGYKPRMVLTLGNHEDRITRAINDAAILEGAIGLGDLQYEKFGWEVIPFLEPIDIGGIKYCHFFTTGVMGRPCTSAAAMLREVQGSAVCGHSQHCDLAYHKKTQQFALMSGICYLHMESYLGPQGQNSRRQVVMLHEVQEGLADPMLVSLAYLERKYS